MDASSKKNLIITHSVGLVVYWIFAVAAIVLGGCESYGLENCLQKEVTVFVLLTVAGIVPILLSIYLNSITYLVLLVYSFVVMVFLFPIGSVLGLISVLNLRKWKNSGKNT